MKPPKLTSDQVAALCPEFSDFKEIGEGGFKTVYTAVKDGQTEVVKVLGIPLGDGTEDRERYRDECVARVRREVEILGLCQTPMLVKLGSLPLSSHEVNGADYVVYSEEHLMGDDLWKVLRGATVRPDEAEAKLLMRCLVTAIRELWSREYIHRDIKPQNVMKLDDPDRPFVLLDLGIAFSQAETALTGDPRMVPATYRYLAPEMADPNFRLNLDYRADLYTTALTVFEFASGQHPIARDSDDMMRTVTRAIHQPPTPLASVRSDYSTEFCALVDQLLKKKPTLRPANFALILRKLEN